jgi:hypothetical protein
MIECRFCGSNVTLDEFGEEHSDRSCLVEAERNRGSEEADTLEEEDQTDLDRLVAIKKTKGTGQAVWHLFKSQEEERSLCGQIEADRGRSSPSAEHEVKPVDIGEPDELDDRLGSLCGNCLRSYLTKQPGYTPPSIREENVGVPASG